MFGISHHLNNALIENSKDFSRRELHTVSLFTMLNDINNTGKSNSLYRLSNLDQKAMIGQL